MYNEFGIIRIIAHPTIAKQKVSLPKMTFHCTDCTQTFETRTRINTHRMKEHQRNAKLSFHYGTFSF